MFSSMALFKDLLQFLALAFRHRGVRGVLHQVDRPGVDQSSDVMAMMAVMATNIRFLWLSKA